MPGNIEEMKVLRLKLTRGYSCVFDEADLDFILSLSPWHTSKGIRAHPYAARSTKIDGKQKILFMHRMLIGAEEGQYVDHVNGDTLDNRRCNLRFCSLSENQGNSKKRSHNKGKYKGVNWNKRNKVWTVKVAGNHLGSFRDELEAAKAYDAGARQHYGEFALVNFPADAHIGE